MNILNLNHLFTVYAKLCTTYVYTIWNGFIEIDMFYLSSQYFIPVIGLDLHQSIWISIIIAKPTLFKYYKLAMGLCKLLHSI
jgi:hypothetical protein